MPRAHRAGLADMARSIYRRSCAYDPRARDCRLWVAAACAYATAFNLSWTGYCHTCHDLGERVRPRAGNHLSDGAFTQAGQASISLNPTSLNGRPNPPAVSFAQSTRFLLSRVNSACRLLSMTNTKTGAASPTRPTQKHAPSNSPHCKPNSPSESPS